MKTGAIIMPQPLPQSVLAFGSQTKNTVCYACGNRAYISGVHADLTSPADSALFESAVAGFLKKRPRVFACDMHPDYISTRAALQLASSRKRPLIEVQHHHAHLVSCMVDNAVVNKDVIGVAFDGTGFGADGSLWGGEFLVGNYRSCQRPAHILAAPLLGGAQAVRQPWRMSYVWLDRVMGAKMFRLPLSIMKKKYRRDWGVLCRMNAGNMNTPLATSMGRLFDAAASLILDRPAAAFEAELAIALEGCAHQSKKKPCVYPFTISTDKEGVLVIDPTALFAAIIHDIRAGKKKEDIACCFHETVAGIIEKTCSLLRRKTAINLVALSGGVFQNALLRVRAVEMLQKKKFRVLTHRAVPCSDAGISLGQAVIAGFSR